MMTDNRATALVSTDWLERHLSDPDLKILDGSFHPPGTRRDARADYEARHIPGARFFDIDGICDPESPLPHMLPAPEAFAAAVSALGIGSEDQIVIYEAPGATGAARVWWTFRVFGHDRVALLDGGLLAWRMEDRPVTADPPEVRPARFVARIRPDLVRGLDDLRAAMNDPMTPIVDNRPAGRFAGVDPEPRPVRRLGHIPGSRNIPASRFVDPDRLGAWRPADEIAALFRDAGVDLEGPVIASCGSGVTAATTAFAAFLLGHDHVAVYDGSWAEWGNRDDVPVETGAG